ncbi:MAG TPA: hypothetical protein HA282_04005 [Nanoarchaeota archaeon]|nr:MAG: hypothetical protein QT01_C0005G0011 [archaeon GW2011_AR6]MBS3082376.1 hypothetical protein [Candidatus Pacearchaeota archaeon]HIH17917.1 hypothetical protein [Nanoarchaeota archaeon]HIH33712.1 hypothetical protein [Nanoarchaeota archaeon]HIH51172.1 hypothetical protein [Nanoarchaeota archaeon]
MALKLNSEREPYKEFYGSNVEQMPMLIADGRVPISVAGLMQRRLDVRNSGADVKSSYMDNYFDTCDAVAYHPDGRAKIVLDSQTLRDMNEKSKRNGGALVLTEEDYETLEGEEFKGGKLEKVNESLSRADAKSNLVWKVLARDQALLDDYVDYIFAEGKERFGYDTVMGVYPSSAHGNTPEMRAWYVGRLEGRSGADGRDDLVSGSGRLLGIAPEAPGAPGKGASNTRAYNMADLQAFDDTMKGLEVILNPDVLRPLAALRKKL